MQIGLSSSPGAIDINKTGDEAMESSGTWDFKQAIHLTSSKFEMCIFSIHLIQNFVFPGINTINDSISTKKLGLGLSAFMDLVCL